MSAPAEAPHDPSLPELLQRIDHQLLPQLQLRSVDPHDPVWVLSLPQPGRPGLEQEAEVYRRIGCHRVFPSAST
ncbi:hypothetical protein NZK32_03810 [Cyanobium sp. FGCU-52]|nr:hypothetical protein [Cyanobium sp. FGCU52]